MFGHRPDGKRLKDMDPIIQKMDLAEAAATPSEGTALEAGIPKTVAEFIFQEKEKFKRFNQQRNGRIVEEVNR